MIEALIIQRLSLRRGGRTLFEDFSLELRAGQAAALIGRNGAGKTSLLRAVAGLLSPEGGTIEFVGAEAAEARASCLHIVGHQDGLKAVRTAREELEFWNHWLGAAPEAARRAVDVLQLATLLDLEVRRLSAGQRRRLAMARLVAAPRRLWLLDEPLSPLDAHWRARFGELMAEHLTGGGLILAAVHDPLPIPAAQIEVGA